MEFEAVNYDEMKTQGGSFRMTVTQDIQLCKDKLCSAGLINPPTTVTDLNVSSSTHHISNVIQYGTMGNYYLDIYKYYQDGTLKEHKLDTFYVAWKQPYTYNFVW